MKVVVERDNQEDDHEYTEAENERHENQEKVQIFKLEILAGNARKVSAVRFERLEHDDTLLETKEVAPFFPKIMKRNRPREEDIDRSFDDENQFQQIANDNGFNMSHDHNSRYEKEKDKGRSSDDGILDHVDSHDGFR